MSYDARMTCDLQLFQTAKDEITSLKEEIDAQNGSATPEDVMLYKKNFFKKINHVGRSLSILDTYFKNNALFAQDDISLTVNDYTRIKRIALTINKEEEWRKGDMGIDKLIEKEDINRALNIILAAEHLYCSSIHSG